MNRTTSSAVDSGKTYTEVESPLGTLTLVATDGVLSALYMTGHRHRPGEETFGERVPAGEAPFPEVVRELTAYFAGELTEFTVPVRLEGTPFQRSVWEQLLRIPYGETWSYGKLAAELGKPNASRAVGLANGKNPVSIIVPCHRVIGASGAMTGYGGGLDRKVRLLELEGR
ncbi:methylated-DNA--[protein]-cysteine S-methyltransferase [Streptomyces lavendulae]|uniref:Methylated-DNA--protein-cysteine methyltransferase n=1 Tax=Streptomyces lavendulae subsp. lavendulae TaxID=58340 RepID=A0A2K8P9U5_STRLA|nr:methylated-DNA--[protein]-cysteine S-methyltransferase [Streptomyces lavendulae]ATZ23511.1 Methylated-DNA--protein-cysteine methyltransferase [Streptomyces lavendulae subsp. lavendulae]QUQ53342.1 Methylated-DNA--protein-cysteine methyltransferase [Streptomyces lavendulae subsp. lavendulae]GLV99334.1 methylated-DNA--protein-cysteine methyltransferase [Streptomyces lavendulae subsp. lavendulae]